MKKVAEPGLEQGAKPSGKAGVLERGGAESGAVDAQNAQIDAELARVIDAWPTLPEDVKASILAILDASR